jgi:hypothetical protein
VLHQNGLGYLSFYENLSNLRHHNDFPGSFPILIEAISGALERRGRFGTIPNHGMAPPDRSGGIRNYTILTFRNENYEFGKQVYELPWIL